jgi:hypothetical protein
LTYHAERSNGTEKNSEGLMRSMVTVKIHNASNYPAKDVHIVLEVAVQSMRRRLWFARSVSATTLGDLAS